MNNDEKTIKYLEMIQNVISRMASNSFQLKALFITILSALIVFFCIDTDKSFDKCFVKATLFVVTLVFWALDSYYLKLERGFRNLYTKAINSDVEQLKLFELNPVESKKKQNGYVSTNFFDCFISTSTTPLYFTLVLVFNSIIHFFS